MNYWYEEYLKRYVNVLLAWAVEYTDCATAEGLDRRPSKATC